MPDNKLTKYDVLLELKRTLSIVKCVGNEKDEPEGTRYIQISDTLRKELINKIDDVLAGD